MNASVCRRGPDAQQVETLSLPNGVTATLASAVLQMQGANGSAQPVALRWGKAPAPTAWLAWNGELFMVPACNAVPGTGASESDTARLSGIITAALVSASTAPEAAEALRDALEGCGGPFAVCVVVPALQAAFVARDPLGRRSVVVHAGASLHISSVSVPVAASAPASHAEWEELPIEGVYHVPLAAPAEDAPWQVTLAAKWARRHIEHPLIRAHPLVPSTAAAAAAAFTPPALCSLAEGVGAVFAGLAARSFPAPSPDEVRTARCQLAGVMAEVSYALRPGVDSSAAPSMQYLGALAAAVWRRVRSGTVPATDGGRCVMVLFSGGIDSTVLALLTHALVPPDVAIELPNVAFGDASSAPDRQSCLVAMGELRRVAPRRDWRLVFVDVAGVELEALSARIGECVAPCGSVMDHNIGSALWFAVRGCGTLVPPEAIEAAQGLQSRLVRVGAVAEDSSATAAGSTADPSIADASVYDELVDVLVKEGRQPEPGALLSDIGKEYAAEVARLLQACGARRLKDAVEMPIARGRLRVVKAALATGDHRSAGEKAHRQQTVHFVQLLRDDDLRRAAEAAAVAAEYRTLSNASVAGGVAYQCAGKAVLMGMGADETLCGYVRHAKHFKISGTAGLLAELSKDFNRLWQRNLGRDDRVAADHGREGRFPFLDEDVLHALGQLPGGAMEVCDLSRPAGVGDKMLLRTCARLLGLRSVAGLVKRAVQFGTRIADRKVRGEQRAADAGASVVNPALRIPRSEA
jgi:asparagine synthetase B (glutamine-hydrolysing)